jgi:hypothetical protein
MNRINYNILFEKVQKEGFDLFKRKNSDYSNSFEQYGTVGILIRMTDKINRVISITDKKVELVNTESLRDTLIDLHNYSAMAIMMLDQKSCLNK